jgi:serine/threonine protein kinase
MTDGAPAAAANSGVPDPLLGRVISGRFRVTSVLARGGMGKVYLAEQAPLGRTCALKVLNPDYSRGQDPEFHKRFFLEASIASKLAHPNTVTIFDFGKTDDGIYYMAMEYLDGQTLHRAIREAGHFSEERTTHVARQICRGLREAHSLGVVHRDLKPANIFLVEHADETDFVKILDFGLVKNVSAEGDKDRFEDLTQAGLFMGSPKYMAPEQIRGERVDARTDVYALGVVMCEMITGKVPFDRPTSVKILMAHANEAPPALRTLNPNVAISSAFEEMIARCLAKSPDSRYRSMDETLAALKRLALAGHGSQMPGDRSSHPRMISESGPIPASLRSSMPPESSPSASHGGLSGAMDGMVHSSRSSRIPGVPGVPDFASSPPRASQGPSKLRSRGVIVIAACGALGVAGVLGYGAVRTGSDGPKATIAAPVSPPPPVVSARVEPPAAPAPAIVKIRINSEPAGATVKEDGVELCGSTPCDIVYKGSDADPAHQHALTLTHQGFRPERTSVKAADATILVRMTRAADGQRYYPQPFPQPQATQRPETAPAPTGYKTDLPY